MPLPIRLSNVYYYRIAGRYIFAGDLFIAHRTIYFFPEVDLAEQRELGFKYVPHEFALIVWAVMYLAQNLNTYVRRKDIWRDGISDSQFKNEAEAYIAQLNMERQSKGFAESLPLPIRITTAEISNIQLSSTGRLSFFAQSDNHDFNVGWRRRKRLRDALWEGELGRV